MAAAVIASAITLASPRLAFAASSCTDASDFKNTIGYPADVPSIGNWTYQADCTLGYGNINSGVESLQQDINTCYGYNLALDGDFGPATQAAVKHVQTVSGVTVDGVYGPQTRNAMKWAPPGVTSGCSKLQQPLVRVAHG
jgi:murein L,D-transpeptidase YcbB/YkuD